LTPSEAGKNKSLNSATGRRKVFMIVLLSEKDRDEALAFLNRDHELNVIMICDITRFGLDDRGHPLQGRYYGARRGAELRGMGVLYNLGSLFVYAPDEELAPELLHHLASLDPVPRYVVARADWSNALLDRLAERGLTSLGAEAQEYMVLEPSAFRPRLEEAARYAEPGDSGDLRRLHLAFQLEYFGATDETEEALEEMVEDRMASDGIAVVESGGKVVAKAEVMARTGRAALIGGVYTEPARRGHGLATACMSLLCAGILRRGEKACLNVALDNVPARHIYQSLGFTKLCDYRMAHF